eukprot:gene8229-54_t
MTTTEKLTQQIESLQESLTEQEELEKNVREKYLSHVEKMKLDSAEMDEQIDKLKYELERRKEFQKSESKILNSQENSNDEKLRKELKNNFDQLNQAIERWKKEVL